MKEWSLSCIICYVMMGSMGTSCNNSMFTCIKILFHYDVYGCVYYETDYDHHVHHDGTMVAILSGCPAAQVRQRVLTPTNRHMGCASAPSGSTFAHMDRV